MRCHETWKTKPFGWAFQVEAIFCTYAVYFGGKDELAIITEHDLTTPGIIRFHSLYKASPGIA